MTPIESTDRPIRILVAALGGEGGGVLTDWIADAARASGRRVQCTSIPGVAQRTGATTYYIEVAPAGSDAVLALTPMPGAVDLVVASELLEAARAAQNGYVTPQRTTLVASTHRVYATSEKSAMGDGRFDAAAALKAANMLARRGVLFDMEEVVREARSAISAVMLGALAGSGALPIRREVFEKVIEQSGIAVKSNLKGFALAYALAGGETPAAEPAGVKAPAASHTQSRSADELVVHAKREFPAETHYFIEHGIRRLVDYQDLAYARLFLERLQPFVRPRGGSSVPGDHKVLCETARHLALRMSFEDLPRVADLKTRRSRLERVRREVDAKPDEPVVIVEYFKPGLEELCGFFPPRLATRVLSWAERRGKLENFNFGVYLRTTTVWGFLLLWLTAKLRRWRRAGHRYAQEQQNITAWLQAVLGTSRISQAFALEAAAAARLIKGYSGTYRRGLENFDRILQEIVQPAITAGRDASAEVRRAVADALTHSGPEIRPATPAGFKPLTFVRNKRPAENAEAVASTPTEAAARAGFF